MAGTATLPPVAMVMVDHLWCWVPRQQPPAEAKQSATTQDATSNGTGNGRTGSGTPGQGQCGQWRGKLGAPKEQGQLPLLFQLVEDYINDNSLAFSAPPEDKEAPPVSHLVETTNIVAAKKTVGKWEKRGSSSIFGGISSTSKRAAAAPTHL